MECSERIKDLLPDYYLGQLSPEESEEVRAHLAEHAACRKELEEVARVLDLVPLAVQKTDPPPGLKGRVMAAALSAPQEAAEETPEAEARASGVPESVTPMRDASPGRRPGWRNLLPIAAAAAVLIAFIGLTWAYVDLRQENERLQAEVQELQDGVSQQSELLAVTVEGTGLAPEARGTAVVDPGTGELAFDVYNLPEAPTGHAYQAWLVGPAGDTLSLGTMDLGEQGYGQMTGAVSEPIIGQYNALKLTVEPVGAENMSGPVYLEASL